MIVGGTLIILALWMAFIWFVDPDGLRSARRRSSDNGLRGFAGRPLSGRISGQGCQTAFRLSDGPSPASATNKRLSQGRSGDAVAEGALRTRIASIIRERG